MAPVPVAGGEVVEDTVAIHGAGGRPPASTTVTPVTPPPLKGPVMVPPGAALPRATAAGAEIVRVPPDTPKVTVVSAAFAACGRAAIARAIAPPIVYPMRYICPPICGTE